MVNTRRSCASDDAAAAAIKRQRAGHSTASRSSSPAPSSGESAMQVFSVELLTQTILSNLDTSSVVHFATFLRSRDAWRHVLSDEKLWRELLESHMEVRYHELSLATILLKFCYKRSIDMRSAPVTNCKILVWARIDYFP